MSWNKRNALHGALRSLRYVLFLVTHIHIVFAISESFVSTK